MLNLDRNDCNILVKNQFIEDGEKTKVKRTLVPIDHGLSIPDTLAVCSYDLYWLSTSQADAPFSAKSLEYIENIDVV